MAQIVVVDDGPGFRAVVATMLHLDGHDVDTASCGQDGLDLIAAHRPDLILLDVLMPGMDGLEVLERLSCQGYGRPPAPVIMLTALTDQGTRRRAQELGASGFLEKGRSDAFEALLAEVARHF